MTRGRVLRPFWPLAIWIAVFGWRTVGCKDRLVHATGKRGQMQTPVKYHYPPTPPRPTIPPGITVPPQEPQ